jgi:hypothetical protein
MPEESFFLKPLTSVLEEALAHGSDRAVSEGIPSGDRPDAKT